jgi:hypothetical protein
MMTVHKCQAVVVAGSWRNPSVKLMAIIVASVSIDALRAVQNVMVPLVGFHDGGPDDDEERNNRSVSITMCSIPSDIRSIKDRPATVVNKIRAST